MQEGTSAVRSYAGWRLQKRSHSKSASTLHSFHTTRSNPHNMLHLCACYLTCWTSLYLLSPTCVSFYAVFPSGPLLRVANHSLLSLYIFESCFYPVFFSVQMFFLCLLLITPTSSMNPNTSSTLFFIVSSALTTPSPFFSFLHSSNTLLSFLPFSLRPTGAYTPQMTSCCWRSMKACSQPPFRPSSLGELPHFKRKWIILWNEWRHVPQWHTHTSHWNVQRERQTHAKIYTKTCTHVHSYERENTHFS